MSGVKGKLSPSCSFTIRELKSVDKFLAVYDAVNMREQGCFSKCTVILTIYCECYCVF